MQSKDKAVPGVNERTVSVQGNLIQCQMGIEQVSCFFFFFLSLSIVVGFVVTWMINTEQQCWCDTVSTGDCSKACCKELVTVVKRVLVTVVNW